jgi:hypothetical protein
MKVDGHFFWGLSLITSKLIGKVLQRPNFGICYFGHVVVIRRSDMIFSEFYIVSRELEGLSVKLNNTRFGLLLLEL